jgi:hypothetical protein
MKWGLFLLWLFAGCQTYNNVKTEGQMYTIEVLNGLPTRHGHLENGAPYELP